MTERIRVTKLKSNLKTLAKVTKVSPAIVLHKYNGPSRDLDGLTRQERKFVVEYMIDLNPSQAAIRAGFGFVNALQISKKLLAPNTPVSNAIDREFEKYEERVNVKVEDIIRRYWSIATADPNALVQLRRICCRYCWGANFEYQRTKGEMERDLLLLEHKHRDQVFNEQGGDGFDENREPNPECPECHGNGQSQVYFQDTRKLSPMGKALYAGVAVKNNSVELKMRDQDAALQSVARHLGMFPTNLKVSGGDTPIKHAHLHAMIPDNLKDLDDSELVRLYTEAVDFTQTDE